MPQVDRDALLRQLRREPDVEAPELFGHDATDRLLIDELHAGGTPEDLVIIGDRHGALTAMALTEGVGRVRVHQDSLVGERALERNLARLGIDAARAAQLPLSRELVADATHVIAQLPRGLDALDDLARVVSQDAADDVRLLAGGRIKHMTLGMNEVLARSFGDVQAGRARQKSRVLRARGPLRPDTPWPKHAVHDGAGIEVVARGAAFAGTEIDPGTAMMIRHLDRAPEVGHALDLACGTGVLAVALALRMPGVSVDARDVSQAAVESAGATARANGVADRVAARRADSTEGIADGSVPLILLNPPFHLGATVHTGIAERLISEAGRALAPGGELWCVWNGHLGYRALLDRIGPTVQLDRDPRHILTVTRLRDPRGA